ncbi:N-acetyl-gamma-glutamyl-phosphate reductase [Elizabethkingia meningoseptica]|uniref:N-acetyl-gamma-glutamyl-phosphate reductase n=1 Tax=Elizabethkingia meningoseptica TaxID=238 RepID=UPI00099A48F7|nr:N-acetyl-gamma-glutamyl-phosphate reductase [Elizabethkingia meningoseptica]MDE5468310.1 N-acetyl-gamma-glutamyl-phosphate reductase [Elizabethkingia meningoseptica]MDE5475637.1 N-acetyl-gamma-glutamyl-phosphate reductase [Elizabethkingia meningoseptica]MDE5479513.1 N-acetyl-gamma-glutamyl-phosphate reductase [Elizabethkingia meningoseptica]MDE5485510.1 N-acetyl-gamma-glutamyl-phosphate reductase [Elizabethkingia meningoseptica]MDE5502915.1 N-acetyl-gamma-glutamyl-phosphate reductase [Eliza
MENKLKAGIVGGTGYTGGELIRLLLNHPYAELAFALSRNASGKKIHAVHQDLLGETEMEFSSELQDADVLFLCLPHKESQPWLEQNKIPAGTKIIDLGNDFRLDGAFQGKNFVYGLPEFQKEKIKTANEVANPGCFASAIQYALLPLAEKKLLNQVFVTGITGSTGAGVKLQDTTHFSWRNNNVSAYKTLTHQHLGEIRQTLENKNGNQVGIHFVPWRGDWPRGIFISATLECSKSLDELYEAFEAFYKDQPFVWVSREAINMKQVVNTNKCAIQLEKQDNMLVVHSAVDNLLKGASGQAIQNMNLMFGFEEHAGLKLKPLAY